MNDLGDITALPLARSTWSAIREHVYRVHAPQRMDALLQMLSQQGRWERVWRYEIKDDPTWTEAERYLSIKQA